MIRIAPAAAAALAAVIAVSQPVAATEPAAPTPFAREIRLGVLVHDMPHLWSGFRLESGVDINAEVIFSPSLAFLGGHLRPALGGSLAVPTRGDGRGTSKVYADVRWMYEHASGLFVGLGIGAAWHDGHLEPDALDRKALGRRVLFHVPLEIGWRFDAHNSISLYFDHISNGYTATWNEGLDSLGVRYGYKF